MIAKFGKFKVYEICYESSTLLEIKLFGHVVDVILVKKDVDAKEKILQAKNTVIKWLENQLTLTVNGDTLLSRD